MIVQINGMCVQITRESLEAIRTICKQDAHLGDSCTTCIFLDELKPYCTVAAALCTKAPCYWDEEMITEILEDMDE